MTETMLQKRIREKAEERVIEDIKTAQTVLGRHPILNRLRIGRFGLVATMGYCPATDLFNNSEQTLLEKETNFGEIKSDLTQKYIGEETDAILRQLAILQEYMEAPE